MYAMNNVFIFAPQFNDHGNDANGAFLPGAQMFGAFCKKQGAKVATHIFNNKLPDDQKIFDSIIHAMAVAPPQLDTVAYFGHGIKNMLVSARIGQRLLPKFITALRANCGMAPTIILYACSCGTQGGIAGQIADGLSDLLAGVYGHEDVGHSFCNPRVRYFPGHKTVAPDGLVSNWVKAIGNEKGDFWMRFPFMTDDEIKDELRSKKT